MCRCKLVYIVDYCNFLYLWYQVSTPVCNHANTHSTVIWFILLHWTPSYIYSRTSAKSRTILHDLHCFICIHSFTYLPKQTRSICYYLYVRVYVPTHTGYIHAHSHKHTHTHIHACHRCGSSFQSAWWSGMMSMHTSLVVSGGGRHWSSSPPKRHGQNNFGVYLSLYFSANYMCIWYEVCVHVDMNDVFIYSTFLT